MNNLIQGYQILIASNFALYVKTHGAHFNVTGMFFHSLHDMFKTQYEELWSAHDEIGENIRKLDAFTPASLIEYSKFSVIDDCVGILGATEYVSRLMLDHDRMIALLNKVFKLAEAENRQDHMDFIAGRISAHSKQRWMLKASLESVAKMQQVDAVIKL